MSAPSTQSRPPVSVSDRLREIIAGRGLSAYSVAAGAGLAPSVVGRFVRRERGLSTASLDAIAGALGLELREGRRSRVQGASPNRPAPRGPSPIPDRPESAADDGAGRHD